MARCDRAVGTRECDARDAGGRRKLAGGSVGRSPGIIPGITQKWIKKEGEVTTAYFEIPDSLIVIDSSGSMPNPDENISIPVLGATVIVATVFFIFGQLGAVPFIGGFVADIIEIVNKRQEIFP